jgi:hypothetical protein
MELFEVSMRGCLPAAGVGFVHDVVVNQGGGVKHFEGRREYECRVVRSIRRLFTV